MLIFQRLGLHSVWSRLLGTMAVVVIPAAILISMLAYSLFEAALTNLYAGQVTVASGGADTVRYWFDAAGRSLANETLAASFVDAQRCARLADTYLMHNSGISGVRLFDQDGHPCTAGTPIDAAQLPSLPEPHAVYSVILFHDRIWMAAPGAGGYGLLAVDETALNARLSGALSPGGAQVVLVGADGRVVAAPTEADWMPSSYDLARPGKVWRCPDRAGLLASYALAPVHGSPLRVLMRFKDNSLHAAWRRLAILCMALLTMMGLLAYVYAATIRRDIVHWIQGIEVAARSRGGDPESLARAPVALDMPRELRSVAESFNAMADRDIERRHELVSSLGENRALMLEMHHRIKNSLQVIQSYLALIRRSADRVEAQILARIEARVSVLAIAYRLALTPHGMRPIAVKPYLEEICAAAIGSLRRPRQRVAYVLAWEGELVIDRAIPLGLGLVEALIAAFSAPEASYVGVTLADGEAGDVELRVESDAAPVATGLPDKVMRGLANQLGADPKAAAGGEILVWRFRA